MRKTESQSMVQTRKPYVAPEVEISEYMVEEGFAATEVLNDIEYTELSDAEGNNEQGGYWFDI